MAELAFNIIGHGIETVKEQMEVLGKGFDSSRVKIETKIEGSDIHVYVSYPFVFKTTADIMEIKRILVEIQKLVPEDVYKELEFSITRWITACVRVVG